jgi:hypothetical protein
MDVDIPRSQLDKKPMGVTTPRSSLVKNQDSDTSLQFVSNKDGFGDRLLSQSYQNREYHYDSDISDSDIEDCEPLQNYYESQISEIRKNETNPMLGDLKVGLMQGCTALSKMLNIPALEKLLLNVSSHVFPIPHMSTYALISFLKKIFPPHVARLDGKNICELASIPPWSVIHVSFIGLGGTKKKAKIARQITQQVVVVRRQKKRAPRKRNGLNNAMSSLSFTGNVSNSIATQFAKLQRDPFNRDLFDARVPMSTGFPTVTFTQKGEVTLSSFGSGSAVFMMFPNPVLSYLNYNSTITAFGGQYGSNTSYYYNITPAGLSPAYDTFRPVAFGLRVNNMMTATTSTGRIVAGNLPIVSVGPSYSVMKNIGASGTNVIVDLMCGAFVDTNALFSTNFLQKPQYRAIPISQLYNRPLEIHGTFHHIDAFKFRNTSTATQFATNQVLFGNESTVYNTATSAIVNIGGDPDGQVDMTGSNLIHLIFEGVPTSGSNITLELVWHFEGTPANVGTGNGALLPAGRCVNDRRPDLVERVLGSMSRLESQYRLLDQVFDSAVGMAGQVFASSMRSMRPRHMRLQNGPQSDF